jgi:hypothetical protein
LRSNNIAEIAADSKSYGYVIRKLIADNESHTKASVRLMAFGTSAGLDIADRCLTLIWSLERCNFSHMNQDQDSTPRHTTAESSIFGDLPLPIIVQILFSFVEIKN